MGKLLIMGIVFLVVFAICLKTLISIFGVKKEDKAASKSDPQPTPSEKKEENVNE